MKILGNAVSGPRFDRKVDEVNDRKRLYRSKIHRHLRRFEIEADNHNVDIGQQVEEPLNEKNRQSDSQPVPHSEGPVANRDQRLQTAIDGPGLIQCGQPQSDNRRRQSGRGICNPSHLHSDKQDTHQ